VKLKPGERDERGRKFIGWCVRAEKRGLVADGVFTRADTVDSAWKDWDKRKVTRLFVKPSAKTRALLNLVQAIEQQWHWNPVDSAVAAAIQAAKDVLE